MSAARGMGIRRLRKELPAWSWSAERHGFEWRYKGEHEGRTVIVYAVSVLTGPSEDDYSTQWRVDDGHMSRLYVSFWMKHRPTKDTSR